MSPGGDPLCFTSFNICIPTLLLHSFNRKEIKQLLSELDEEKKIRLRLQVLKSFIVPRKYWQV